MSDTLTTEASPSVEELVPHRGRLRLVDRVRVTGEGTAEMESVVRDDWPLAADGEMDGVVLVEVIAQSCAALMGWEKRHEERSGGRGFLVGVRRARFLAARVAVGTRLTTQVTVLRKVGTYRAFEGRTWDGERLLCEAEIQGFRPDEEGEGSA